MGLRIPLTWGQIRVVLVVFFFFLAVNLVLYTSALFSVTSRTDFEVNDDTDVGNDDISARISLRSRWNHDGTFLSRARRGGKTDSGEKEEGDSWVREGQGDGGKGRRVKWLEGAENTDVIKSRLSPRHRPSQHSTKLKPDAPNMAATSKEFDAERVFKLFQSCKDDDGNLSIDCYNDAYEELCKLFKPLGTVFSFVTSDIVEKIGILRDYRKSEVGEHFSTVQTMVKYEVDNKLTDRKKKASGCRTLLRLHRALEFISALLSKIRDTDNSCKFSSEAKDAYDTTLAKFHPWVIKKAVQMAMYTLPDRENMMIKMKIPDTAEGMSKVAELITQLKLVYDATQQIYAANDLLDLP